MAPLRVRFKDYPEREDSSSESSFGRKSLSSSTYSNSPTSIATFIAGVERQRLAETKRHGLRGVIKLQSIWRGRQARTYAKRLVAQVLRPAVLTIESAQGLYLPGFLSLGERGRCQPSAQVITTIFRPGAGSIVFEHITEPVPCTYDPFFHTEILIPAIRADDVLTFSIIGNGSSFNGQATITLGSFWSSQSYSTLKLQKPRGSLARVTGTINVILTLPAISHPIGRSLIAKKPLFTPETRCGWLWYAHRMEVLPTEYSSSQPGSQYSQSHTPYQRQAPQHQSNPNPIVVSTSRDTDFIVGRQSQHATTTTHRSTTAKKSFWATTTRVFQSVLKKKNSNSSSHRSDSSLSTSVRATRRVTKPDFRSLNSQTAGSNGYLESPTYDDEGQDPFTQCCATPPVRTPRDASSYVTYEDKRLWVCLIPGLLIGLLSPTDNSPVISVPLSNAKVTVRRDTSSTMDRKGANVYGILMQLEDGYIVYFYAQSALEAEHWFESIRYNMSMTKAALTARESYVIRQRRAVTHKYIQESISAAPPA